MSSLGEELVLGPAGVSQRDAGRMEARLKAIWHEIKIPLLVFLAVRVFISAAVYFIAPTLPASPNGVPWQALPEQPLLDVLARWDSAWYANIALVGYRFATDHPSNIAFLPAYPIIIKAGSLVTGNVWISGILVSNLAFLGSLMVLFKLTCLKLDRAAAGRAVLYTSIFPAAFFFYSMYSESVYLLAVLLAFYLWERRQGWFAGMFGGLAALTRPMGILLFLAGAARSLVEERHSRSSLISWNTASLFLVPLALGVFLFYSYAVFGEPLAFLKSREVGWNEPVSFIPASHRELFASVINGTVLTGGIQKLRLLDASSAILFLALVFPVFKRLGPSYGIFTVGSLLMPLIVNLDGLTRYVSVVFPGFMVMGAWAPRKAPVIILAGLSMALMALMASGFARWYFVG